MAIFKNNKKEKQEKRKVLVIIVGIVAVLLAFIGATFAYFSAVINTIGGNESVVIKTVVVRELEYNQTKSLLLENAEPGNSDEGGFTVHNPNTNATATYSMEFVVDSNNFTNTDGDNQLIFTLSGGNLSTPKTIDFTNSTEYPAGKRVSLLENVTISSNNTDTYTTKIEFVEKNINQNSNQTKTFVGHIEGKGGDIIAENIDE